MDATTHCAVATVVVQTCRSSTAAGYREIDVIFAALHEDPVVDAAVRLDELVGETVEAMRPQADAQRVRMCAPVPDHVVVARADPERLQRVLFNLIQNAIRHTPADGSVTVVAEANPSGIEVEVADARRVESQARLLLPP